MTKNTIIICLSKIRNASRIRQSSRSVNNAYTRERLGNNTYGPGIDECQKKHDKIIVIIFVKIDNKIGSKLLFVVFTLHRPK